MKNILHISDLHLSLTERVGFSADQCAKVLDKIIEDVTETGGKHGCSVDTVFFTGDLAFSGDKYEFEAVAEKFLLPLLDALNLSHDDLYIVPGNHDSTRSAISKVEMKFRVNSDNKEIDDLYGFINKGEERWPRMEAFCEFRNSLLQGSKKLIVDGVLHKTYKVSSELYVICANSAWLAQDDEDKGCLQLTKSQVKSLTYKIPSKAKKILLTHHPIDWLSESDRAIVSSFIEKEISMFCYGHMHDFKQKAESSFSEGITLSLQAGTLDTRNKNSGYSLIVLNSANKVEDGRVFYRKYNSENEFFEPWEERGERGVFDFSTGNMITFDTLKFSEISSLLLKSVDSDLIVNTGLAEEKKKSLLAMFIEPNFETPSFTVAKKSGSKSIECSADVFESTGCTVVFGPDDSGKTFLLKYLYSCSLKKQINSDYTDFGFFIDANRVDIKNKYSIMNMLCEQYYSPDVSTSFEQKIKRMVSAGYATIYIDNFDLRSESKVEQICKFMKDNISCKFVISSHISSGPEVTRKLAEINDIKLSLISIGMLKRKDIRKIVEKWIPVLPLDCENNVYDEVTKVVNNSQLPHNYFVYSMLLAIYEVKQDVNNILNESDVIENFIEVLLKKHCMDRPSNKPQYKELLHFMGYLSKQFFVRREYEISMNDVFSAALQFNQKTMNSYDIQDYIRPLISSGILLERSGLVCFSQVSFIFYALSYFMKHDEELRVELLSDENYLLFDKVVEYFSSQHSSDFTLLDFISKKVSITKANISSFVMNEKGIDVEELDFDNMGEISVLDIASGSESFEKKVAEIKADRERDDERLDEISPLKSSNGTSNEIILKDSDEPDDLGSILRDQLSLYSRVFRSTELIMDTEEMLRVFDDLVEGYVFLTKYSIINLDEDLVIPLILPAVENKLIEGELSSEEKDKLIITLKAVMSIVRASMPNHIQNVMSYDLCSRKRRISNIVSSRISETDSHVVKCFLLYLLMDMNESDTIAHVKTLMKEKSPFAKSTLFFKVVQILSRNYSISQSDRNFLQQSASALIDNNKYGLEKKLKEFNRVMNLDK